MATTDRAVGTGPIHLNFRSVQQVVIEPADENRFMMTAKEAARACEKYQSEKELREAFSRVMVYLHDWCSKFQDTVRAAFVYPGDGYLNILICTNGTEYRTDFDDAVTELDLDLTRQFDWLTAEVMQVPENARTDNVALEKAIIVYGDGSATRPASEPQSALSA